MIVSDEIRKSVVFIGYRLADDRTRMVGTGFLVARPFDESATPRRGETHTSFSYLVTAKHVIDGIRDLGLAEVLARVNYRSGEARWVSIPIEYWVFHPTESSTVDVAVLSASGFDVPKLDHGVFPIDAFAKKETVLLEKIGLGEEIFIVGLFASHHGSAKNIPIVRIGNIAGMPEEKVSTQIGDIEAYLIEARSIGGISGSPVFVNMGIMRDRHGVLEVEKLVDGMRAVTPIYLLGMVHGHFDKEGVNMGIGIVVPSWKILEVINQEYFLTAEKERREAPKSFSS
jgi:hypothetical protein